MNSDVPKSLRPRLSLLILFGLAAVTPAASAQPTADGLYAGFTTSAGEFWCRLEYQRVPRTVANFVSLAEGSRDWIDFPHASVVRRPYYQDLVFHRVIDKFMIQTGSPNGRGTDGPGYQFADEFHNALRHSKAGILSMANSGPNSNGSQFFITVTNTPWLDNRHSVFGEVVLGIDVVHAISKVPTDTSDRPLTPVRLDQVRILRVGAAAEAFNPAAVAPPLPDVGQVPASLVFTRPDKLNLLLQSRPDHTLHAFFGTNLTSWVTQPLNSGLTNVGADGLLGYPAMFFRVLDGGLER